MILMFFYSFQEWTNILFTFFMLENIEKPLIYYFSVCLQDKIIKKEAN